jgi:hypothetical protein
MCLIINVLAQVVISRACKESKLVIGMSAKYCKPLPAHSEPSPCASWNMGRPPLYVFKNFPDCAITPIAESAARINSHIIHSMVVQKAVTLLCRASEK